MNIYLIIVLFTIGPLASTSGRQQAFLEESYFFTEVSLDYGSHLRSLEKVKSTINTFISAGSEQSNTVKSRQMTLPTWLKSALTSTIHKINLSQDALYQLLFSYARKKRNVQDLAKKDIEFQQLSFKPGNLYLGQIVKQLNNNIPTYSQYTSILKNRFKRQITPSYAPFEFIGDLNSFLTGTPSASQYRHLIKVSENLADQGRAEGKILHGIIKTQHSFTQILSDLSSSNLAQQQIITNLTTLISAIENDFIKTADITHHSLALISCADTFIYEGQILHSKISNIFHAGDSNYLSRSAINPAQLKKLFKHHSSNQVALRRLCILDVPGFYSRGKLPTEPSEGSLTLFTP